VAKNILMDWQRGEIPFMKLPPDYVQKELLEEEEEEEPLKDEAYEDFKDDE
jgi:nuclear GTP-binding protein